MHKAISFVHVFKFIFENHYMIAMGCPLKWRCFLWIPADNMPE